MRTLFRTFTLLSRPESCRARDELPQIRTEPGTYRCHRISCVYSLLTSKIYLALCQLEESLPNYDEALHHLHTAREDVIFAITCLQRYDEPNADAELLSTTRIHPRRSVTSPTLTPSSASVQKDKDMVEMTLTDFHGSFEAIHGTAID